MADRGWQVGLQSIAAADNRPNNYLLGRLYPGESWVEIWYIGDGPE